METKITFFKRISQILLLIALIATVLVACKKKSDTPTPIPPSPNPPPVAKPAVFPDKTLKLMTDWEITNHQPFAGHYLRALGKGLMSEGDDPEIPNPFKKVGKTLWEIHDYIHTEKEFKEIDQNLREIQNQLNTLESMITGLGQQINLQTQQLENFFSGQEIIAAMVPLTEALDSSGNADFGYYPVIARRSSEDSATWHAAMVANSSHLPTYANTQITPPGGGLPVMQTFIGTISTMISSPPASGYDGCLHTYNKMLINLVHSQYPNGMDSSTAMKAYQMLENYFLWMVGGQFQAENILINCSNVVDSLNTQHLALSQWTAFQPLITPEIALFLKEVDFFVLNLDEYRSLSRWNYDVQYADVGLAPDNLFINVLARAQFLANSLYNGLGFAYPVVCGKIVVPYNYTVSSGATVPTTSISLNSTKQLSSTAVNMTSWFPNTVWPTVSDISFCDYSFNWSVFTFGVLGQPDGGWSASNSLSMVFTDSYTPWAHSSSTGGSVSTKFHNPQDLNDVSSSYDTVHCMQFGYFSADWKWGYMLLRYGNTNWHECGAWCSEQIQEYAIAHHAAGASAFLPGCSQSYFNATSPFVVDCHTDWTCCVQDAYTGNFQVDDGGYQVGLSEMAYNGPAFNYSEGQTAYDFNMYNTIQANRTISGNTAWFAWQAACWYNFGDQFNCNGGVGYITLSNMHSGTNINSCSFYQLVNNSAGGNNWATTSGWGGNFSSGSQMQVNFGFDLFINKATTGSNLSMLFHPNTTVVFGGVGTLVK
jgi:hypothetical protein